MIIFAVGIIWRKTSQLLAVNVVHLTVKFLVWVWFVIFLRIFVYTNNSSEQFFGLSIRYPSFNSLNKSWTANPGYGTAPKVTNSHNKIPKLQTSDLLVYIWSANDSGAIHLTGTMINLMFK